MIRSKPSSRNSLGNLTGFPRVHTDAGDSVPLAMYLVLLVPCEQELLSMTRTTIHIKENDEIAVRVAVSTAVGGCGVLLFHQLVIMVLL